MNKTSRTLILISIVGIFLSVLGFFYLGSQTGEVSGKDVVGQISRYKNDTRLKRSENIHWYPVNQEIKCFENDLIFTGPDSTALIELKNGTVIQLFENSLISLSADIISLESGVIEIDSKGLKGIKLESFGKVINMEAGTRIKIQQDKSGNKIIPLSEKAKTVLASNNLPKNIVTPQNESIDLLDPLPDTLFPNLPDYEIKLAWKNNSTSKNLVLNLYKENQSEVFLSKNSNGESEVLLTDQIGNGNYQWSLKAPSGLISKTSGFSITSDIEPRLIFPENMSKHAPSEKGKSKQRFEWLSKFKGPYRIQVSLDRDFSKISQEFATTNLSHEFDIEKSGKYYWRVGLTFIENQYTWSEVSEFEIEAAPPISPISIKLASRTLDFSLNTAYVAQIVDPNKSIKYQISIFKDKKRVFNKTQTQTSFAIQKLEEGSYRLIVLATLKNNKEITTEIQFKVKNAPALEPPKIIKKKSKLFVKAIQYMLNLVIPSAHAQEQGDGVVQLEWEATPGISYEIEIYDNNKKIISRRETDSNTIDFFVEKPGDYFWRVRSKSQNRYSPYSEYVSIKAQDKISLIKKITYVEAKP